MILYGPSWTTFGGSVLAIAAVAFPFGAYVGASHEETKAKAKLFDQQKRADEIEAKWQTNLEAQNELDSEQRARMVADYDRGLERLRQRAPVRMPEAAASACVGASPAQLSGPDAANLERFARDARAVQLDLEKARVWIETVTGKP